MDLEFQERVWASGERTDTHTLFSYSYNPELEQALYVCKVCVREMVQGQREGEGKYRTEVVIFGDTDCRSWINELSLYSYTEALEKRKLSMDHLSVSVPFHNLAIKY